MAPPERIAKSFPIVLLIPGIYSEREAGKRRELDIIIPPRMVIRMGKYIPSPPKRGIGCLCTLLSEGTDITLNLLAAIPDSGVKKSDNTAPVRKAAIYTYGHMVISQK